MATSVVSLQQIVSQCESEGLSPGNCARLASEIAKIFGVFDDEVAILRIVNNNHLTFLYPEKLKQVGVIPLNNSSAVAARTALSKRPEVLNNFAQIKHASIFEAVPVQSKTRPRPPEKSASVIQKIMTAPVLGPTGPLLPDSLCVLRKYPLCSSIVSRPGNFFGHLARPSIPALTIPERRTCDENDR